MITGAYLYFHPSDDPHAQARLLLQLLSVVRFSSGNLLPAIDVETMDGMDSTSVVANLQAMVNDVGRTSMDILSVGRAGRPAAVSGMTQFYRSPERLEKKFL